MSSSTILTVLNSAVSTATDVFTSALPILVTFSVGLILFWVIYRKFRGAISR